MKFKQQEIHHQIVDRYRRKLGQELTPEGAVQLIRDFDDFCRLLLELDWKSNPDSKGKENCYERKTE